MDRITLFPVHSASQKESLSAHYTRNVCTAFNQLSRPRHIFVRGYQTQDLKT